MEEGKWRKVFSLSMHWSIAVCIQMGRKIKVIIDSLADLMCCFWMMKFFFIFYFGNANKHCYACNFEKILCMHISLVHTFTHTQQVGAENVPWCITDLNKDFSLCETYPTVLGVPVSTSEDDLRTVAQFRSKGRIPVSQKKKKKKILPEILPEYFMLKMCIVPCNQKFFAGQNFCPAQLPLCYRNTIQVFTHGVKVTL